MWCRAELQGKRVGLTLLWGGAEPWVRMSRLGLQGFRVEHFGYKAEPFVESARIPWSAGLISLGCRVESLGVQG